jgi:hypothetical protein
MITNIQQGTQMTTLKLNAIVTKALIDRDFRAGILNGRRKECLTTFGLSDNEMNALLSVQATNLDQFIQQLSSIFCVSDRVH